MTAKTKTPAGLGARHDQTVKGFVTLKGSFKDEQRQQKEG